MVSALLRTSPHSGLGEHRPGRLEHVLDRVPSSALVTAGLVGGFALARESGRRELGGAWWAICGAAAARSWLDRAGAWPTLGLSTLYVAAMGGSHPLAKQLGPWRSVLAVTALSAGTSWVLSDRRLSI